MPTILAVDTTSDACSVALKTHNSTNQSLIIAPREHTQRLLPMVESILADTGLSLQQLDAIAYGCGPGSFTGLRIALSVVQGLAYGADLPLIAVSSLDTMAKSAVRLQQLSNTLVLPIIDARMDEVYWSAYTVDKNGQLEKVIVEQVSSPEDCYKNIIQLPYEYIAAVGSGWHYPVFDQLEPAYKNQQFYPAAYDVAELGADLYKKGELLKPTDAKLTYLRNEISWKKRERIRGV
ncbi:MAG: tRNA (adenosine(37)-N6)-threonylcarbamoyltransferase complex dimerization subunit type 1 TsaB [Cellvibrionaceae bacterium]